MPFHIGNQALLKTNLRVIDGQKKMQTKNYGGGVVVQKVG